MSQAWADFGGTGDARIAPEGRPTRVGVIANFSACTGCARWRETVAARFFDVDRDSFEDLFARIDPHLQLTLPDGTKTDFRLRRFDDLRPEALLSAVPWTEVLLRAREVAEDPSAMHALLASAGVDVAIEAPRKGAPVSESKGSESLLDALLAQPARAASRGAAQARDPGLASFLRQIADASAEGRDHRAIALRRSAIDAELARRLSILLHHPQMQALEAAWRSLRDLVFRLPGSANVQIRALDVSRPDLMAELAADIPIEATKLHRLCVEAAETPGELPYDLLVVDFEFGADAEDARLRSYLGSIARRAGARVLAGARAELADRAAADALAGDAQWRERRSDASASEVRLAAPRVLARLPYGSETDPVEGFAYEESAGGLAPSDYCWRSSAFLIARALLENGGGLDAAQIEDLPMHVRRDSDELGCIGPLERLWTDREVERVAHAGLVPLSGARNSDAVRLRIPR